MESFNQVYLNLLPIIQKNCKIASAQQKLKYQDVEDMNTDCYIWALNAYNKFDPIKYPNADRNAYILQIVCCHLRNYHFYIKRRKLTYKKNAQMKERCNNVNVVFNSIHKNEDEEGLEHLLITEDKYTFKTDLQIAIDKFPEKYKKMLYLTKDGYNQEQIGKILGLTQARIAYMQKEIRKKNVKKLVKPAENLYKVLKEV